MTVLENVMFPLTVGKNKKSKKEAEEIARKYMKITDIEELEDKKPGTMSGGQQQRVAITRALVQNPRVLLLDEPAAGMNESETQDLMDSIRLIREKTGVSILLIEHDMNLVLGITERLIVLNYGEILAEGDPHDVISNKEVVKAYLGS